MSILCRNIFTIGDNFYLQNLNNCTYWFYHFFKKIESKINKPLNIVLMNDRCSKIISQIKLLLEFETDENNPNSCISVLHQNYIF